MAQLRPCPSNSFRFNSTLCACNPGYLMNPATKSCALFQPSTEEWMVKTGIDYTLTFPATILSFDTIKKFTQSQAIFLEATLVMLLSWLAFCFLVRFWKLGDGRTPWFQIRWWISRLDFCYATRHWLEDHKVVMKRKTELGGTFSIASWILFIGLFAALLYQVISKRTVEVHNIRATNAPDLLSFNNDMEFNITTVSSMTCSHLRGLGTVVTGTPGFIDQRASPLANFANYSCHNTSQGPTISIKCSNCHIIQDNLYISWHFIDLPNDPATAVGFQFNLTARKHADEKHVSFVSGILRNVSNKDNRPVTFRGVGINILKFNLFPRLYHNFHDLRLIQPLFHEFLRGSSFSDSSQLQASLQSSTDGLINMTLYVNYLSAYIVEIDNQNVLGPVGFLADLGGLYAISIAIFLYFLVQCEYRIKKLRNEDSVLREIRNRRKAQDHWDKLRKYVMYTWGCKTLDDDNNSARKESLCTGAMIGSFRGNGSLHKTKKQRRKDDISFNRKVDFPIKMNVIPESANQREVKSYPAGTESNFEGQSSQGERVFEKVPGVIKDGEEEYSVGPQEDAAQNQDHLSVDRTLPPPPPVIDFGTDPGTNISDIQRNLQNLYEYNVLLREKFVATQAQLEALAMKASASETKCESWQSKGA